ncbi:MAG TPA: type II CAAX endopeptidase family protein [Jatrophihabitans sp.]
MIIAPEPVEPRPRLDQLIDLMRRHDPRPWGWRPVWVPCLGLVVAIVAGAIASHFVNPHGFAAALATVIALTAVLYTVLVASIWLAGRELARRYAGWGWTFGLQRPKAMDFAWLAAGFGIAFGGRIVVAIVASAVSGRKALEQSQNLVIHSHSVAVYLVLGVIVVLIAPLVEELMFRGLMLRTMMRRWGFWPAALASSAIFALFHTYEVGTVAGALTLAGVVFTLGLANCLLARWSGRLAAGIMNHMLFNGLAITVLIAMNT